MQTLHHLPGVTEECFALLDDCQAGSANPLSRLYTGHTATLSCSSAAQLDQMLEQMQQALQQGQHAVGIFSYELGEQLHGIAMPNPSAEVAQILLFKHCRQLSGTEVESWLSEKISPNQGTGLLSHGPHAGILRTRASVSEAEFDQAIAAIHRYIEAGDTYQINYTYRLFFETYGSIHALYKRLRARQPVPYGALIGLPDGRAVLSFSPELFVQHGGGTLIARPMKGTAAASGDPQTDAIRAAELARDPKNRAENLMIVDLLRNDLGQVAIPGSVQVPALFSVNRHSSVLQMTSTITARIRSDVTLPQVFHALYPCGSITGAPKRRTLQIIRQLENTPRGIYTGAIGWFDAPQGNDLIGNFVLSVPIRTLVVQPVREDGLRAGEMGVGAGIVHDSRAHDEFAECKLKAGFLTGLPKDFQLLETMYATQEAGCRHLERHLARLRASADYFDFVFDELAIRAALSVACQALSADVPHRVRLALHPEGSCDIQAAPLPSLAAPVKLLIADQPVPADDIFLRHKTTIRTRYDAAWRMAESQGAFDMLFFNMHGELTEGARSSVFVKSGGRWLTPPLESGVLPGIMRAVLLDDPDWSAIEQKLTVDHLQNAERIVVCNALRGALDAVVDWSTPGVLKTLSAPTKT